MQIFKYLALALSCAPCLCFASTISDELVELANQLERQYHKVREAPDRPQIAIRQFMQTGNIPICYFSNGDAVNTGASLEDLTLFETIDPPSESQMQAQKQVLIGLMEYYTAIEAQKGCR